MKHDLTPEYLGVHDAEAITGISRWTWRRWAYDGRIESVKLGTRLLIPRRAIDQMVAIATRPKLKTIQEIDSQG